MKLGTLISVFFFGMIGGTLRYLLGLKLASTGTILVNLIGSFCLAFLTYYVIERQKLPAWLSTGLGTGMVGAFTTFSTFTVDVLGLSTFTDATFYLLISVVGGFLLAYTGMILGIKLGKVVVIEDDRSSFRSWIGGICAVFNDTSIEEQN